MKTFSAQYKALNKEQKRAVDTIDGPVMVIAGPGTGKTQLLSMRVANILQKTDTNPNNILCLTYTESGAAAMRERLIRQMGKDAYKVAIHTFHSFGSEIINSYGEYFYHGAHFRPSDELSGYEIMRELFEKLPHDNPLASTMNGEFTALKDTQSAISDLKKSGIIPEELHKILDHNDAFITYAEPILQPVFADRLSKKTLPKLEAALAEIGKFQDMPMPLINYAGLSSVFTGSLEHALQAAADQDSTKPITAWKSDWLTRDDNGNTVFKDQKRGAKLRAVATVYYDYLIAMQAKELYDFDDMILRVVHALEVFNELKLNLQEQYQYILVDEFQDTNGAQMRLLWNLTNNEVYEGRPNILVVGDDDQAIFSFQGAEISNIRNFLSAYKDPAVITLTDNYRSTAPILELSRSVITQCQDRLEHTIEGVNKTLQAQKDTPDTLVVGHEYATIHDEHTHITDLIKEELARGVKPSEIAVICRNHAGLQQILPHLKAANIPVAYEKRDNVLDAPPVALLELLARIVNNLSLQKFDVADSLMPELLAHPAWGIPYVEIWRLGLSSYTNRRFWLQDMLENKGVLRDIAEWLIINSQLALVEPLEVMLDRLTGAEDYQVADSALAESFDSDVDGPREEFVSPLRQFYFNNDKLRQTPHEYVSFLSSLHTLRRRLREYRPDAELKLGDFCDFIVEVKLGGFTISSSEEFQPVTESVQLLTAHKSKGQEFEVVFVIHACDSVWGSSARSRYSSIGFPHNLPLAAAGTTDDERVRLLYVAMTRAKKKLVITAHKTDGNQKETRRVAYLHIPEFTVTEHEPSTNPVAALVAASSAWHESLTVLPPATVQDLLAPTLKNYKLSVTHLNNFIDVTNGGPQAFLLQNILRFPQVMHPSAAYGSAIHGALQRAHAHLTATGKRRPVEDVLNDYEKLLYQQRLSIRDSQFLAQKGSDILSKYLAAKYDAFHENQVVERNFATQGIVIDGAHITGAIDVLDINDADKSITIVDYKTGKSARRWQGLSDFEKIKLHKYKQQLLFYKLLVDGSRDWGGKYKVELGRLAFVEPAAGGEIVSLDLGYDSDELARFKKLITVVWKKIQSFDMPDITAYEPNYKGVLAFENDLIDE